MENLNNLMNFSSENINNTLNIKIIGIGGAGNNIVDYLASKNSNVSSVAKLYAFNTDALSFKNISNISNLYIIDQKNLKGYGCNNDPQKARNGIENDKEVIAKELANTDVLFLYAGLGRGAGSGATCQVAKIAHDLGIFTIAIVSMPSSVYEGEKIYKTAFDSLQEIKTYVNSITVISNDYIISNNKVDNFYDLYTCSNDEFVSTSNQILDLLVNPSKINLDFSSIKTFFTNSKFFLTRKISFDDDISVNAFQTKLKELVKESTSDININNANKIIGKFICNKKTSLNFLVDFQKACANVFNNDVETLFGIDYNDCNKIELSLFISATDELETISKQFSTEKIAKPFETNSVNFVMSDNKADSAKNNESEIVRQQIQNNSNDVDTNFVPVNNENEQQKFAGIEQALNNAVIQTKEILKDEEDVKPEFVNNNESDDNDMTEVIKPTDLADEKPAHEAVSEPSKPEEQNNDTNRLFGTMDMKQILAEENISNTAKLKITDQMNTREINDIG